MASAMATASPPPPARSTVQPARVSSARASIGVDRIVSSASSTRSPAGAAGSAALVRAWGARRQAQPLRAGATASTRSASEGAPQRLDQVAGVALRPERLDPAPRLRGQQHQRRAARLARRTRAARRVDQAHVAGSRTDDGSRRRPEAGRAPPAAGWRKRFSTHTLSPSSSPPRVRRSAASKAASNQNRAPLPWRAVHPDHALEGVGQPLDDGEAETRAAGLLAGFRLNEVLEDAGAVPPGAGRAPCRRTVKRTRSASPTGEARAAGDQHLPQSRVSFTALPGQVEQDLAQAARHRRAAPASVRIHRPADLQPGRMRFGG